MRRITKFERPALSYFWVALGSAIGGFLRWQFSAVLQPEIATEVALASLIVNTLGSFIIGFCAGAFGSRSPFIRHFMMIGFCGGFTTFSLFSLENLLYLLRGEPGLALLNIGLSLFAWLLSVCLGFRAAAALTGGRANAR